MQRSHRRWHRLLWLILGPLAIAAFLYALLNRSAMPVMDQVPGSEAPQTQALDR